MAEYSLRVKIGAEIREFTRKMKTFKGELQDISKRANDVGDKMSRRLSLPIFAAGGAALAAAGRFERLRNGLVAVTGDAGEAGQEFERLREAAQSPGLTFAQAVQGSVRLQSVGFSADLARQALLEFGNALAIAGGEADDLGGVALALTQIASKGQVMSEELRQIQERVPQITQAMEEAFGTSQSEEIQEMGLTAQEFVRGVVEALGQLERAEGGLSNAFVNLRQTAVNSMGRIGEVVNEQLHVQEFMENLADFAERAAEAFEGLDGQIQTFLLASAGTAAIIGIAVKAFGLLTAAVAAILSPIGLVTAGLVALGGATVDLALNWGQRMREMQSAWLKFQRAILNGLSRILATVASMARFVSSDLGSAFQTAANRLAVAADDMTGDIQRVQEEMLFAAAIAGGAFDDVDTSLFLRTGEGPRPEGASFAERLDQALTSALQKMGLIRKEVQDTGDDTNEVVDNVRSTINGLQQVGFFQERANRRFLQGGGRVNLMDQFWGQMTLTSIFGATRGASAPSPLERIQQQIQRESAFGLIANDTERAQRQASLLRDTLRKFSQDPDIDPESMGIRELIRALQEAEEEASQTSATIRQLGTRAISQFSQGVGQIVGGFFGGGRGQEQLRLRRFQLQEQLRMLQDNLRRREISQREYALRVQAIQQQLHDTERELARETADVVQRTFRNLANVVADVVRSIIQDITQALVTAGLLQLFGLGGGGGFGALFRQGLGGGGFGGGVGTVVPSGPTMAAIPLDIRADTLPSGAIVVSAEQGNTRARRRGQQGLTSQ